MRPTRRRFAACLSSSLLAAIACFCAIALPSSAGAAGRAAPTDYDQFIVRFKDASPEKGNAMLRQARLDVAGRGQGLRVAQLRRMAVGADVVHTDRRLDARGIKQFLLRLRADPRVEYAEVDLRMVPAFTPDDTQYASQWHYFEPTAGINAPGAWDLADGTGQVIAVIDTGSTPHSDLDGNTLPGYDFISDATSARDGDGRDANPNDEGNWYADGECGESVGTNSNWHGTHVAGTLAAVTGNASGVAGVAFGARIQHARVLGKCGGSLSDIADAIVWAAGGAVPGVPDNTTPAGVINLSLGGLGSCSGPEQAAIDAAVANGATVVVAAGNSGTDATHFSPANCRNVLTVAALDRTGARASYSNYGSTVEIAAPGGTSADPVLSTLNTGTTTQGTESYAGYKGTSMATPHVAGVAALVGEASGGALTPAEIMSLIQATARDLPVACPLGCGAGLVDATAAVTLANSAVLSIDDVTASEGNAGPTKFTFTVKLSRPVAGNVTFSLVTSNGTAVSGSDYNTAFYFNQAIPAGGTSQAFDVYVNGDTQGERDETFSMVVSGVVGNVTVIDDTGTGTIRDDDATALANGVPLTGLYDAVTGHDTHYTLEVPYGATNLEFTTSGETDDVDLYVQYGGMPSTSSYDCRSISDGSNEGCSPTSRAGTWYVMLNAYTPYSEVTLTGSYTVPVQLSVGDAAITEGNAGTKLMTFTVSLSGTSAIPVVYNIATANNTATAGTDYVASSLSGQTIPAGQLSKVFSVTVNGDATVEPNEILRVNLANASVPIADGQGTGTIINDDGPALSIADAGFVEGDSGLKVLVFTVSLTQASASPVAYDIATNNGTATAGSDYAANNRLDETIPAGQLSKTFQVTVQGDTAVEGNETFFVNLSNGSVSFADGQATATITNDDGPILSIGDASLSEPDSGSTMMTFTVSLSKVAPAAVTFNFTTVAGSALAGPDFVPTSVTGLRIPAGQLAKVVSVPIKGDLVVEPDETFSANISLSNVSIKDGLGIGTILNDD
jgi:serine protease